MLPLLRYTLDLFEEFRAQTPEKSQADAPDSIAKVHSRPDAPSAASPVSMEFRHPCATRQTRLGDALVAFELRRGKRRSIGFSVRPEGLVVSAPKWVPLYQVDAALREKSDWILRKLTESRAREAQRQASRIEWREGASLPFLGAPVRLVLDPCHEFEAIGAALITSPQGDCLHLALPRHASAEQIREEQQASQDFGRERVERDVLRPDGVGRRYHNGEDVYGNLFPHSHQKSLTARPKKKTR